jgi:CHAT domain-containing protein
LLVPALCLAIGTVACSSLPPPRSGAPSSPAPALAPSSVSQTELRLKLAAGEYVRLAVSPALVVLVVRQVGPNGTVDEIQELPIEGDHPTRLSWLITTAGEYRWTVEPRDPSATSCAIWLEEQRPAGPCDGAQQRAERELIAGQRELSQAGESPAARAAILLASALSAWNETGDEEERVATLLSAAEAERRLARIPAATELCNRALALARRSAHRQAEAQALQTCAQLLPAAEKLDSLNSALALRQAQRNEIGLAGTLFRIGEFYNEHGGSGQALEKLRHALELQLRSADTRDAAGTLREIGVAYRLQGDARYARLYLDLGLEFSLAAGDMIAEATARHQSADLHLQNGELQAAYEQYTKAQRLLVAVGERGEAAWALAGVANCILHLGDGERAREKYQEALTTFELLHDQTGRASTLLGLGAAFEATGDSSGALAKFQQALVVIRESGMHGWEALALYDLGKAHRELDQPARAILELEKALEVGTAASPANRAQILAELGNAHSKRGDLAAAERAFKDAIRLSPGGQLVEAAAQAGLARIERDRGDLAEARSAVGRALDVTEKVRSEVIREDQRISFLASRRAYFELEVDLLMRLDRLQPGSGYGPAALAASEQARARSLLDLLDEDRLDIRQGISPELKEQRKEIGERITRLETQRRSLPSRLSDAAVQSLEKQLLAAEEEEKNLDAETRRRHATFESFRPSEPLPLRQIQGLLDERTALLEFFLGSQGSYLFVVTSRGLATHSLPASEAIKPLVDSLQSALHQDSRLRSRRYADDAYGLYRQLLLPAAGELRDKRHMIVVPDGFLYSLSFEALLTEPVAGGGPPERNLPYLIRKLSVSYIPSANVLAQLLTERLPNRGGRDGNKLFVGFADPSQGPIGTLVTDDGCARTAIPKSGGAAGARWSGLGPLPALPAARNEVCRIASLFPPAAAVVFVGPDATEENVKTSPVVTSARNLHFAAHGHLDEAHPDRSGIELAPSASGEDGLLQVREIMNLELHADLVVLSACQSGVGKEVSGEGLIGMTRAFLYAGAASLVVSLWQVDDESTADLMVRFYDHLRAIGDKSEALRRAKLDLIDSSSYSPYYWAPFVLVGLPH